VNQTSKNHQVMTFGNDLNKNALY